MQRMIEGTIAPWLDPNGSQRPTYGFYRPSATEVRYSLNGVDVWSAISGGGGGINNASVRNSNVGAYAVRTTTDGTNTAFVITDTYVGEIQVTAAGVATGVALFNGTAVAGNVLVALYNAVGALVANSNLAGVAQAGMTAFQRVPFTAPVTLSPGTYYVAVQGNNTGGNIRTIPTGNFGTALLTGGTFGTLPTAPITVPTTFTAAQAPIAGLY